MFVIDSGSDGSSSDSESFSHYQEDESSTKRPSDDVLLEVAKKQKLDLAVLDGSQQSHLSSADVSMEAIRAGEIEESVLEGAKKQKIDLAVDESQQSRLSSADVQMDAIEAGEIEESVAEGNAPGEIDIMADSSDLTLQQKKELHDNINTLPPDKRPGLFEIVKQTSQLIVLLVLNVGYGRWRSRD